VIAGSGSVGKTQSPSAKAAMDLRRLRDVEAVFFPKEAIGNLSASYRTGHSPVTTRAVFPNL